MKLFFWRITRIIIRFILRTVFFCRIRGLEHLKGISGPFLIASNHISAIDPFVIASCIPFNTAPAIHFVTYHTFMKRPILGPVLRAYGALPVRNGIGIERALAEPLAYLKRGEAVGIFPEGKVMREGGRFGWGRPGVSYLARGAGVPVVPVVLKGTRVYSFDYFKRHRRICVTFGKPFFIEERNDLAGAATVMRKIKDVMPTRTSAVIPAR